MATDFTAWGSTNPGILSLYNRGDRRRWYWPCPHCGEYFQPAAMWFAGFRDIADPVLAVGRLIFSVLPVRDGVMPEQNLLS